MNFTEIIPLICNNSIYALVIFATVPYSYFLCRKLLHECTYVFGKFDGYSTNHVIFYCWTEKSPKNNGGRLEKSRFLVQLSLPSATCGSYYFDTNLVRTFKESLIPSE